MFRAQLEECEAGGQPNASARFCRGAQGRAPLQRIERSLGRASTEREKYDPSGQFPPVELENASEGREIDALTSGPAKNMCSTLTSRPCGRFSFGRCSG